MKLRLLVLLLNVTLSSVLFSQQITQTIRGVVKDKSSLMTLPGVNIVLTSVEPNRGTATDTDGNFSFENVPVGRHQIRASFIGYETYENLNLELTVSKQLVLEVLLEEQTKMVDEVVVKSLSKTETINQMSTVSARTFSIEETNRFAGSMGDVSRMASSFAGVKAGNDALNEIVIRGNSPNGLLWRFEGVDIPNPNHFGRLDGTSGPVSMLNNNVLSNSDFFTGAFPADYGNALSGVFDLRMRKGNSEKYEFLGQIGFNGFELGAEGPISRKKGSSFLINYRYSTLAVMNAIGMDFGTGTAIPFYQDITGKAYLPISSKVFASVFFLGGISNIEFVKSELDSTESSDDTYGVGNQDVYSKSATGIAGASVRTIIDKSSYMKMTMAYSGIYNNNSVDSLDEMNSKNVIPFYRQNMLQTKQSLIAYYNKKFSAHTKARIGAQFERISYDLHDSILVEEESRFRTITQSDSFAYTAQPYVSLQHKLNNGIVFNVGLRGLYLSVTDQFALEPRAGVKWLLNEKASVSLAYGLHAQYAPLNVYFAQHEERPGYNVMNNIEMKFQKSNHFVAGFDYKLTNTLRFKTELYYQYIPNALIDSDSSVFSMLNYGGLTRGFPSKLVNEGTGENYGIEFTLEKFMDRGMYFLTTLSLYDSKYTASDSDELRNTAFSNNYVFNFIGGKEVKLNKNKEGAKMINSLTFDTKFNWSGGMRYIPLDLAGSQEQGSAVYDESRAYEEKMPDYLRLDVRVGFKSMTRKLTQEWAFDLQNATNRKNPFYQEYNPETQRLEVVNQIGIFPMFLYRITF